MTKLEFSSCTQAAGGTWAHKCTRRHTHTTDCTYSYVLACVRALICVSECVPTPVSTVRRSVCMPAPPPPPVCDDEVTGPSLLTSQFNLDLHNPGANFHREHPSSVSRQVTWVRQLSHVAPLRRQTGAKEHAEKGGVQETQAQLIIYS